MIQILWMSLETRGHSFKEFPDFFKSGLDWWHLKLYWKIAYLSLSTFLRHENSLCELKVNS